MPKQERRACSYHRTGVPYPDIRAHMFFQRGCWKCEEKLAAGIVTGDEPPPPKHTSFEQATLRAIMRRGPYALGKGERGGAELSSSLSSDTQSCAGRTLSTEELLALLRST